MTNKLRSLATILILLGAIGVAFNILFGRNTIAFLSEEIIPNSNLVWYKFDIKNYIDNLTTTITDTTELKLQLPTREFHEVNDAIDFFVYFGNNMAVIVNYVILVINILLYPLKIGGYLVKFVLAIIGFNLYNTESGIWWLGEIAQRLVALTVPYI